MFHLCLRLGYNCLSVYSLKLGLNNLLGCISPNCGNERFDVLHILFICYSLKDN